MFSHPAGEGHANDATRFLFASAIWEVAAADSKSVQARNAEADLDKKRDGIRRVLESCDAFERSIACGARKAGVRNDENHVESF